MHNLLQEYFSGGLSRRGFFDRLIATGFTAAVARTIVDAAVDEQTSADRTFPTVTGTGGDLLVEQVKAAVTKDIFTNPGSYEVGLFDALTDRPGLLVVTGRHVSV